MKPSVLESVLAHLPLGTKVILTFKKTAHPCTLKLLEDASEAGYILIEDLQTQGYVWSAPYMVGTWEDNSLSSRSFVVTIAGHAHDPRTFPPALADVVESYRVIA